MTAPGTDGAALEEGVALLHGIRHPGVVEPCGETSRCDPMRTAVTPHHRLVDRPPATAEDVARMMAIVATTVADLHDLGVAHGAIGPDAIVVTAGGRPMLDRFEHASAFVGSTQRRLRPPAAAADDRALGELLAWMTQRAPADVPAAVLHLAAAAAAGRLSAREIATAVLSYPAADTKVPKVVPRRAFIVGALPLLILAGTAAASASDQVIAPRPARRAPAAEARGLATPRTRPRPTPPDPAPAPSAPAGATTRFARRTLTVGADRFAVGEDGDAIATGRWRCLGIATVALLRPRTGEVWVFADWPKVTGEAVAERVAIVPGGTGIDAVPAGACDTIVVRRRDAPAVAVRLR